MAEISVFSDEGKEVVLIGPVKKGGEGSIYSVKNEPGLCAKIYFKEKLNSEIQKKITAMIKNPPGENLTGYKKGLRSSSISWPVSSLYASQKKDAGFLGFTMPLVDTSLFNEAHRYYDPDDRLKTLGGSFSWLYLLTAAFNISYVVSAIHEKGHRIGDMSASNILIARTAAVSIIDCDSFQIEDQENKITYYTKVATGDFLPPELMGKNFREENIDRYYSDLFALGVIIFKLLMNGFHPYQARGEKVSGFPTTEQKIINGFFPYVANFSDIQPPKNALPYNIIPPRIRDLFSRCFVSGHKNKNLRPTATEWAEALRGELSGIRQCRSNNNHWYSGHLDFCPWCRMQNSRPDKKDIFPPDKIVKNIAVGKTPFANEYRPAKIFTPIIRVLSKKVDLRPLNNNPVTFQLEIENVGDGILTGKISSDRGWIRINNSDISTAKKASAEVSIDKSLLPPGYGGVKFAGNVIFSTNGGTVKIPVTIAAGKNPRAELSVDKIMLKHVKKDDTLRVNVIISNKGDGILSGSVKTNRDWLKVLPENFSTFTDQTLEVIIDAKKAGNSIFILGKIEISSNGGFITVPVGLTLSE